MRFRSLLAAAATLVQAGSAMRILESNGLATCMDNSLFTATLLQVAFTPDNGTLNFRIDGLSQISGKVLLDLNVIAYGLAAVRRTIDPCNDSDLSGLCPMNQGEIPSLPSNIQIPSSTVNQVPNVIYYIPDIDAKVRIYFNSSTDGTALACVEASLSNTQSVYQKGAAWSVAVIAGLALATSAIISGLGFSNASAHIAALALSLWSYFQSQAFLGMTAVTSPPIVRAWQANFQWSMGIIRVGFLQKFAVWYLRATGGQPSTLLQNLATQSVLVMRRSMEYLTRRTNSASTSVELKQNIEVSGIVRVGFVAGIDKTSIWFTGYVFLLIFVIFVTLGVVIFKFVLEGLVKAGKLRSEKFAEFRAGWTVVLKGILFRIVLISFPQMAVLCLWELTVRDSPAEVVLAVSTLATMIILLGFAAIKVWRIAKRSIKLHGNSAYTLYSDPASLNKYGFLYVQFRSTSYYFIVVVLGYIFVKAAFTGLAQAAPVVQAIAFVIIEAAMLITLGIIRPYMSKRLNAVNISIASMNLFNAILLLFFSGVFNLPGLAIGIMGVLYFIVNVVFAFVILIMVIIASIKAITSKNPDIKYYSIKDDRGSFIRSSTNLAQTTELDALGATARGEHGADYYSAEQKRRDLEEDSLSSRIDVHQPAYNDNGYNNGYNKEERFVRSESPFGQPNRPFAPSRGPSEQPSRTASPANPWQRGLGY